MPVEVSERFVRLPKGAGLFRFHGSLVSVLFSFSKMGSPHQSSELLSLLFRIGHRSVTLIQYQPSLSSS